MVTKSIRRDNCRLCLGKNIQLIVEFEPVPLSEKYSATPEAAKEVERFPIDLYMCLDCGHVQQLDIVDADVLWDDYTYSSGQTQGIVDHFNSVAKNIIETFKPAAGSLVIDIGSNDGSLLQPFKAAGYKILGIDPAKEIAKKANELGITTLPEYMSIELAGQIRQQYGPASVIAAFNTFAHMDDLGAIADSVKIMLGPEGVFVFECQYLMDVIDKFLLGTVFHEHMSHHSLKPMVRFLAEHGLELIDVQRVSIQQGSIVGTAQHVGGPKNKTSAVTELLTLEQARKLDSPEAFKVFTDKLDNLKTKIARFIDECKKTGATIAGYGAARSGPTMMTQLAFGSQIDCIFDDHPMKVNKYSPGYAIEVLPTSKLNEHKPDYVFILAVNHAKKIVENNRTYLEGGGKFVVCFPDLEIIDAASALN